MLRATSLSVAAALGLLSSPCAQDPPPPEQKAAVAQALREWVADFENGRLGPRATLRHGDGLQPAYVRSARAAGLVLDQDDGRITHLDMLGKLTIFAEQFPSVELADAMLGVAGAGFEHAFLDHNAIEVRELGHWSLLRMDHAGAWFLILRAAGGDRSLVLADLQPAAVDKGSDGLVVGPARRVAALRLLGMKNKPVFRSTIEASLSDDDPRVRLAAAEALDFQRRLESLPRLLARIQIERHPVVSQALVHAILVLVPKLEEQRESLLTVTSIQTALQQFGRLGWRADMDLLELAEKFPKKEMIPSLIEALQRASAEPDKLVATVNARASLQLRDRAAGLLKAMTGALIADDDPQAWRAFWKREQDNIVVPKVLARERGNGTTRAQFFGVPVTGASIAFLIDTSGSMEKEVLGTAAPTGRRSADASRLGAAKEQIVLAVSAMDPNARYQVMTFAGKAQVWTREPVKPGPHSTRSLTELLSRLRPNGGTNLFDGLVKALQLDELGYGQQHEMRIDELFVLSDGEPTEGDVRDPDEMLRVVREANKYAKVRIHCVFTGTGTGADLLRRLAEENDGVFVQR